MFELGWTEILLIAVVAIVVIGPKDLPRAMRGVGQWTGRIKRMAGDFQRQFNEAVREAELDDVKNEVAKLAKIDPMADLRKTVAKTGTDLKADLKKVDDSIAAGLAKPDAVNPVPKTPPAVAAPMVVAADAVAVPVAVPEPVPVADPVLAADPEAPPVVPAAPVVHEPSPAAADEARA